LPFAANLFRKTQAMNRHRRCSKKSGRKKNEWIAMWVKTGITFSKKDCGISRRIATQ
jgi:hypothetical protein